MSWQKHVITQHDGIILKCVDVKFYFTFKHFVRIYCTNFGGFFVRTFQFVALPTEAMARRQPQKPIQGPSPEIPLEISR